MILWNCNFNSFNFKNLCNIDVKLPDDDTKMSKHVAVYII
jgi:hypothetical protein